MKILMAFASLALAVTAAPALAAKHKDKEPAGPRACLLADVSPNALACTGFFAGNLLNNRKVSEQTSALNTLGFAWDGNFGNVTKIDSLNGSTTVNFSNANQNPVTRLYGDTWVGIHFGGGAGLGGQATGFWKINAGMAGLASFLLNIAQGSSGAVLYRTQAAPPAGPGGEPVTGAVPEPASWAMMIAGFGFVGAAMRRRRPVTA